MRRIGAVMLSCSVLSFPQAEEAVAVPLRAGDVAGDGRQGLVAAALPVEPVLQPGDDVLGPVPFAPQPRAAAPVARVADHCLLDQLGRTAWPGRGCEHV